MLFSGVQRFLGLPDLPLRRSSTVYSFLHTLKTTIIVFLETLMLKWVWNRLLVAVGDCVLTMCSTMKTRSLGDKLPFSAILPKFQYFKIPQWMVMGVWGIMGWLWVVINDTMHRKKLTILSFPMTPKSIRYH